MQPMEQPLHPEILTWTALLGRWIDFAKTSVALPRDAEGMRWRQSVAAVINLQAVTFALAELAELAPEDRPLAMDRAAVLIDENVGKLAAIWGNDLPDSLLEINADAQKALTMARSIVPDTI